MTTQNLSDTLQIEPIVEAVLRGLTLEGIGDAKVRVGVRVNPFDFPSVGTRFLRVTYTSSGQANISYFLKRFDPATYCPPSNGRGPLSWRRSKTRLPPSQLEHLYLNLYRQEGCSVPASRVIDDLTLAMEDCGAETLEERLRDKAPDEQEKILAALIPQQARIAIAGRKIKLPSDGAERVNLYSDLSRDFTLHFKYWRRAASGEETEQFLDKTRFFREGYSGKKQYFLGDNATFHILFRNNTSHPFMWVDLERIKEGTQTREPAGIYFSPESNIGFEAMERLLYACRTSEEEIEEGKTRKGNPIDEKAWREYLKDFYKVAVVECFRRGTKIRELEMFYPEIYERFTRRHTGFRNAFSRYQEKIAGTVVKVNVNGLYNDKEKEAFKIGGDAILDLMSK